MSSGLSFDKNDWALILGASSGFGAATARELARQGMNVIGIHFDRAATLPAAEAVKADCEKSGARALFFNVNASDEAKRNETLDVAKAELGESGGTIRVLLHSLAFGSLRPLVSLTGEMLSQRQIEMTMDVMANTLVYWTQGVITRGLMKKGGRIFAMTSSGGHSQLMNYGAVSAAKAALESYMRQLALELGPMGITANTILAGVTDTPALRKIPGAGAMLDVAKAKNPSMRNGTAEDVAKGIALMAREESFFISGNVIRIDGGEDIVEYIGQKSAVEL